MFYISILGMLLSLLMFPTLINSLNMRKKLNCNTNGLISQVYIFLVINSAIFIFSITYLAIKMNEMYQ